MYVSIAPYCINIWKFPNIWVPHGTPSYHPFYFRIFHAAQSSDKPGIPHIFRKPESPTEEAAQPCRLLEDSLQTLKHIVSIVTPGEHHGASIFVIVCVSLNISLDIYIYIYIYIYTNWADVVSYPRHPEVTPGTKSYWHTGTTQSLVWQTKYLKCVRAIANHIFNTISVGNKTMSKVSSRHWHTRIDSKTAAFYPNEKSNQFCSARPVSLSCLWTWIRLISVV